MENIYALRIAPGKITITARGEGLDGLYAATECEMVEIVGYGKIGGVEVSVIADEEGLLKSDPELNLTACDVLAVATKSAPAYLNGGGLVGTCSLVHLENLRGFTANEVARIISALERGGFPL
jgi:hypothetical protein